MGNYIGSGVCGYIGTGGNMRALKMSDYFQIIKPEYIYLKLTPTTSIRNYNSDKIAKAVHHLYRNAFKQFERQGLKIKYKATPKMGYMVYIEKGKVEFYFIVPKLYVSLFKEKISETWPKITIQQVDSIPVFNEGTGYYLTYAREDALSLAVDKRTNELLSSTLNVLEVIEDGDRLGIFYNFLPMSQFQWRAEHDTTIEKLRQGKPVDRDKLSTKYVIKTVLLSLLEIASFLSGIMADLFGNKETAISDTIKINFTDLDKQHWSNATSRKKERLVLDTQIAVLSQSKDKEREINNAVAVCEGFKSISEDNELVARPFKIRDTINFENTRISRIESIKVSVDECQNFLALPGRELLEQHGCIEKIDTIESEVPEELRTGTMCIGNNTCKGKVTKAYLTSDREYKNLTLCIIGPNRAGKSTLIGNLSKDGLDHGECDIIFDFCGNCELSNEVSAKFSNVLNIDCSDFDTMQGLGYNEVRQGKDAFEQYRNAKTQTSQLLTLINSIVGNDADLRARMERYLESAANIVFMQNGAIRDVFTVLQDYKLRLAYIQSIPKEQEENLAEYRMALEELDEWSKATKDNPSELVGSKISFVQGILNRVNKLKQNTYLELMLKKDCTNNIDLVEEIQKSQLICLRMPEVMFSTETEKDIYATYWLTKIWLALQIRKWNIPEDGKRIKVNIFIDELYQVPQAQDFLRSKLSQMPKFTAKNIISCHHLKQIPIIRDELKSANCSYMLIAGSNRENYAELKSELYPYTEEDLLNLKRYQSLNLLKTNNGFARFITQLPKPI